MQAEICWARAAQPVQPACVVLRRRLRVAPCRRTASFSSPPQFGQCSMSICTRAGRTAGPLHDAVAITPQVYGQPDEPQSGAGPGRTGACEIFNLCSNVARCTPHPISTNPDVGRFYTSVASRSVRKGLVLILHKFVRQARFLLVFSIPAALHRKQSCPSPFRPYFSQLFWP